MEAQRQQQDYEFERTLMHGRYRSELSNYAREVAAAQRQKQVEDSRKRLEVRKQRRLKKERVCMCFKKYIAPYIGDWLFIFILGILMASLSFLIDYVIEQLGNAHEILSLKLLSDSHWTIQAFLWILFPLLLVLFSVGFVQLVSIHAIGSGIPEMKTILRGVSLPNYLSLRTFVSKTVALVTAVGSTLPIGKEGPFVHICSIIADVMTRIGSRFFPIFNHVFVNEAHTNELLAAACAVGVSSNFAAPIGGVLFSIEVTSTYFAVRNYWRGFFGAVSGAFIFRLAAVWFKEEEETITALFKTSFNIDFPFDPQEILAFAFIGLMTGFGSALFVYYHRKLVDLRRRYRKYTRFLEYNIFIYPAIVTVVITVLSFPLGLGQYMAGQLTQRQALEHLLTNFTWLRQVPDQASFPDDSIQKSVLENWGNTSIFLSLILFILFHFVFTGIAVALPIPAGVFFPVFLVGAAFGRLVGETMDVLFHSGINGHLIAPGGYAVVGAAAMAGGVTHTISTSVIVFELTGQITHILPVMIAVLISVAIASLLQPSFYDSIIQIKELPFLPDLKLHKYYNLYASDIMRRDLLYLSYQSTYRDLRQLLKNSKHSSFPLVDNTESRVLIGSVSRLNLWFILNEQLQGVYEHAREIKNRQLEGENEGSRSASPERPSSPKASIVQSMSTFTRIFKSPPTDDVDATEEDLAEVIESEPESSEYLLQLEEQQLSQTIIFDSILIDPSPFQLVEMTSLTKVHSLFSLLSLSHAYVTSLGKLVGVVTLSDLSEAIEGKQFSRLNQQTSSELRDIQMRELVASDEETDTNVTNI